VGAKLTPAAQDLRLHAEKAIVLLAQARAENAALREPEALEAMDLGARRLDLIGMKFEMAEEMGTLYTNAVAKEHDKTQRRAAENLLDEMSSTNGRCQDLRDAYSALKSEYSAVWLGENRPYWLNNVTVRYDVAIELWQRRGDQIQAAIRGFNAGKDLPPAASFGLPAASMQ
jgi:hypothetical protein